MSLPYDSYLIPTDTIDNNRSENSLNHYFSTLWLRRKLLLTVTLSLSFICLLVIKQLVPRYSATTQLLVGVKSAKVVDIEQVLSGNFAGEGAVIGEMEQLKSRELARTVIETLKLDQYPEFNPSLSTPGFIASLNPVNLLPDSFKEAISTKPIDSRSDEEKSETLQTQLINRFLSKLSISQIKRSQVVNVSFESEDPKLAAKIVNTVADKYIVGQLQAKFDATKKATDWLNNQLGDLKQKVESSENAVQFYRKNHDLVEVSKNIGLSQQQLSEINSQLIVARSQRAEAEAKYHQIEAISRSGRDIDSVADVLNSALISGLRQQESEVQRKYSEMLVEFGPRHPKMIQMQAELEDIHARISLEIKKIAAGLRNNMEVAHAREASLLGSLRQIEVKTSGNNQDEVQLRALEREATANKALFETFLSRFKETTSTQGIEQADARVISTAEVPLGPSFPNKNMLTKVSFVASLGFAVFLVFLLEFLNPGVRSPEQIQALFNVATLGIVPKIFDINSAPHDYLLANPQSALAESINTLRISLSLLNPDSEVKTVLVTSSVPAEGKSTLASLIARHSARAGQRVVLIETDIRRPAIASIFGIEKQHLGLTDLLSHHDLKIEDVLANDPETDMKILTRGKVGYVNPVDLFASKRMRAILQQLRDQFDLVILDSPPIMTVPDARILQGLVDKTIYVLSWDSTPKKVVRNGIELLTKDENSNLAGIVLQQVNLKQYGRYGYGDSSYYYHYGRYNDYYVN